MKFLMMILDNEAAQSKLPPAEMERIVGQHRKVAEELTRQKKLVNGSQLRPSAEATTIRLKAGKRVTVDGPFAETREVLGGYYVIDVASKAEALEWAAKLPMGEGDAIELRPLWES